MRHHSFILCASIAACGYASLASATNPPLAFTLDLLAPCTQSGCTGSHPTDINLNVGANSFSYAPGTGNSFVTTMSVSTPIVCDEIASTGALGATSPLRLAPTFSNGGPGGLLEFNAGGASVVDLNAMVYDGGNPPGVLASYGNSGAATPQVVCYQINPISGGPVAYATGPSGIFSGGFEAHLSGEPWVSVQTVNSPLVGSARPSGQTSATPLNDLVYVVQIHNPVAGWHLDFGDDAAYFGMANNGSVPANWCVLTSAQPGPLTSCGIGGPVTTKPNYVVAPGDIQSSTNSVYLQVVLAGSSAATSPTSGWPTLNSAFYPAVASIFPPYGTYPQRFDDKVAVASVSNLPTLNIGSIVCNNDKVSTSCVLTDPDGHAVPAALKFANAISGGGTVMVDPLAYFVDPTSGTTLPGNLTGDLLNPSNVSCTDPAGILASPIGTANFTTSPSAQGGKALGFGFTPSGSLYLPGTATCTATFTSNYASSLPLSTTQSFTITMLPATVTHFAVSAPTSTTAGAAFNNVTVTALDGSNNTVASYSGTVQFTSTDRSAMIPANATLTNGSGTFSSTLKTAGSQTITATDAVTTAISGMSNPIAVSAAATTRFVVNAPSSATTGVAFNISVIAQDQFNNTASGYAGTVRFTSTDMAAMLPGNATLTFGVGSFSTTLLTPATSTITAADVTTSSIAGTSSAITVN